MGACAETHQKKEHEDERPRCHARVSPGQTVDLLLLDPVASERFVPVGRCNCKQRCLAAISIGSLRLAGRSVALRNIADTYIQSVSWGAGQGRDHRDAS